MDKRQIVIATGNSHKVEEIQAIIGESPYELIAGAGFNVPEIDENGETYEMNAIIKAKTFSKVTGLPAIADDSGLEVDALNGRPGVRSNRFFGEALTDARKVQELLKLLVDVPMQDRTARFVSHAVVVSGDRVLGSFRGTVEGVIALEASGEGGFGYDPVFFLPEAGVSFAELTEAQKNKVSHRGGAMRQVRDFLLHFSDQSW